MKLFMIPLLEYILQNIGFAIFGDIWRYLAIFGDNCRYSRYSAAARSRRAPTGSRAPWRRVILEKIASPAARFQMYSVEHREWLDKVGTI